MDHLTRAPAIMQVLKKMIPVTATDERARNNSMHDGSATVVPTLNELDSRGRARATRVGAHDNASAVSAGE
jgi:hypothetical protein